jgi:hypothetical protein
LCPGRGRGGHLQHLSAHAEGIGLGGYGLSDEFGPKLPQGLHLLQFSPTGMAAKASQYLI